jgi:hypothetical protein
LTPICQICYRRIARVAMSSCGPVRLTLDDNIRARAASGLVFNPDPEGVRLSEHRTIIEMKYRLEIPAVFKELVEKFVLNPMPISKYRLAAVALEYVKESAPGHFSNGRLDSSLCLTF